MVIIIDLNRPGCRAVVVAGATPDFVHPNWQSVYLDWLRLALNPRQSAVATTAIPRF
jgi:hypothetical protein